MSQEPKTIYLIRHAESDENRRIASLARCFKKMGKFKLPSSADVFASTELLNVPAQVDSNVSEIGVKQITQMGEKLKSEDFVRSSGIQLVAHSPLLRAQQTSEGMLGCRANSTKADTVGNVLELDLLSEKTPQEWMPMYYSSFKNRIASFEDWLGSREENVIAIVGHSQYFKAMLDLDFKFGNCDVWKVSFDLSKRDVADDAKEEKKEETGESSQYATPTQWQNLEQVFACEVEGSSKEA